MFQNKIIESIDYVLNRVTMYRLILYYLIGLLCAAMVLSLIHALSFSPFSLLVSVVFLLVISWIANTILAKLFKAQTNFESVYISALILALIVSPAKVSHDFVFLGWAAVWTMASKYIVTLNRKHLFNPVAFGVWFAGIGLQNSAIWWVGTGVMVPFVFLGGLLVVRKIQRADLVASFLLVALITMTGFSLLHGNNLFTSLTRELLETPLFFFAFVMLTEPLTIPPTNKLQQYYGGIVGFLFAPQVNLLGFFTTPELALLLGNLFAYYVSPKIKLFLHLKEKIPIGPNIFDYVFVPNRQPSFTPGQYMEWTLAHPHSDARGTRRYFTLASSPTEDTVRIGVRFYDTKSSYKKRLLSLDSNKEIIASQISGDFVLPKDASQKLVLIAGGIGITPFRSMIKYLLDTNQKRTITLFYSVKSPDELVYKDIFDEAAAKLGIIPIYTVTDKNAQWNGRMGRVTKEMIEQEVPDYKERIFYLSGPQQMVKGFEQTLKDMHIPEKYIKKDYFPGFV